MNRSDTEAKSGSHWSVASTEHTRLSGSWLIGARWAWTVAALLLAGNFVFSIPPYYAALRTVCTVSIAVVDQCATWQLVPDNMSALARLHISLDAYAAYTVLINVVASLLFWAVGILIFWRKSREWLGLDAGHVRPRNEQPGLDGRADRGDGGGEDVSGWPAPEPYRRICAASAGGPG